MTYTLGEGTYPRFVTICDKERGYKIGWRTLRTAPYHGTKTLW